MLAARKLIEELLDVKCPRCDTRFGGFDGFDAPFAGEHDKGCSVSAAVDPSPPKGWYCALSDRFIGGPVAAPHWYMRAESDAVHEGTQQAATCGLHAVNHALRPLGTLYTWAEFDHRSKPEEKSPSGDWELGALLRNVHAAGASLRPVEHDALPTLARWNAEQATLTLWDQDALGCVMHTPGHWVALSRPDVPQTVDAAALLCDSLQQKPYALGVEDVRQLFALIAAHQRNAPEHEAGHWSVHVVERAYP